MGVMRWLVELDRERFEKVNEAVAAPGSVSSVDDVKELYEQFGESWQKAFDGDEELIAEAVENRSGRAEILNSLVESHAQIRSWELDKAIDLALEKLLKSRPEWRPVARLFKFGGDIPLHQMPSLGGGLWSVWSPESVGDAWRSIKAWEELEGALDHSLSADYSLWQRLRRDRAKAEQASAFIRAEGREAYFAEHWRGLRLAIAKTHESGHLLGMGMSI